MATLARSATLGMGPNLGPGWTADESLAMFRRTCVNRAFELEVKRAYDDRLITMPIYLSIGAEQIPAAIATVSTNYLIFAQHRGHSYYLSFGGDRPALVDELLHRETGCARGMGGSASIHDPAIGMYGHSGLMGDQVPIAVGAALGAGRRVLTVMGDASAEEDYVFGAMAYAATKRLPVLFVCEDNDLSILTRVETRRSWSLVDVARSLGMAAEDLTDDPWLIAHHVRRMNAQLPALLNIRTCRHLWHSGTGQDAPPEWDRFALIQDALRALGLGEPARAIEEETQRTMQALWHARLPKRSKTLPANI